MHDRLRLSPRVNHLGKSRHSRNVFTGIPGGGNLLLADADELVSVPSL